MTERKLILIQEENLCEINQNCPGIFDKPCKWYKERDSVTNAWEGIANSQEFIRDGTYYSGTWRKEPLQL